MRLFTSLVLFLISTAVYSQSGKFFGVATDGIYNSGQVFHIKGDGTGFGVDKTFGITSTGQANTGRLVLGPDDNLYGVTSTGGSGNGLLFRINTSDDSYEVVYKFTGPGLSSPIGELEYAPNGYFYGYLKNDPDPAKNGIYRIKPDGTGFQFLVAAKNDLFIYPGLTYHDGYLYGIDAVGGTNNEGAIFRIDLDGNKEVIFNFQKSTTGSQLSGNLLIASNGKLYGMTVFNANNRSTVFSMNTDGSGYQLVKELTDGQVVNYYGLFESGGKLFGSGNWSYFQMDFNGANYSRQSLRYNISPGTNKIYGKQNDNSTNAGLIFSMNLNGASSSVTSIARMPAVADPALDQVQWLTTEAPNGYLYGITLERGPDHLGKIFKVDIKGQQLPYAVTIIKDLYSENDGSYPQQHFTSLLDGTLIGATRNGGVNNKGTIFTMKPDGTGYKTILNFGLTDTGSPADAPVLAPDGFLYGLTANGDIYRMTVDGADFRKIYHHFNFDGLYITQILPTADGWLYGLCRAETWSNHKVHGFIFRIRPDGSDYTQISVDANSKMWSPVSLILGPDNVIYGASTGDTSGGTIFKMNVDGTGFSNVYVTTYATEGSPVSDIFINSQGDIIGFARKSGGYLVYKVKTNGTGYTILHEYSLSLTSFTPSTQMKFPVVEGPDHLLYGMVPWSNNSSGAMFKMGLDGSNHVQYNFNLSGNDGAVVPTGAFTFVPDKQQQTITFNQLAVKNSGDVPFDLTATATSSLGVTFTSSNTAVATVSGNTVTIVSEGTTVITANQSGDNNYFAAPPVQRTLLVGKITPEISITSASNGRAGDIIELTNDFDGPAGLVTYTVDNETGGGQIIEGNKLKLTKGGAITVTASIAEGAEYHAGSAQQEIEIKKRNLTFSISSATNGLVGRTISLSTQRQSSTGTVSFTVTDLTGSASLSGNTLTLNTAGDVRVDAHIEPDDMYKDADVSQILSINETAAIQPQIYGCMASGGSGNGGLIYSMNTDGSNYRVLVNYNPEQGVLTNPTRMVTKGDKSYGVLGTGEMFELDADFNYRVLGGFVSPRTADLITGSDGNIYGVTGTASGSILTIFKVADGDPVMVASGSVALLSTAGVGGLGEYTPGIFYGYGSTTNFSSNVIFEFNANTNTITSKLSVSSLSGSLGRDSHFVLGSNNKMYIATSSGNSGIYEYDPVANTFTQKVSLQASQISGGLIATGSGSMILLSGTGSDATRCIVYEYQPGATTVTPKIDTDEFRGYIFRSGLTFNNGKYYAMPQKSNGTQVLLEVDITTGTYKEKMIFANPPVSYGGLTKTANNKLISMWATKGEYNSGSIFEINTDNFTYDIKYDFKRRMTISAPDGFDGNIGSKLYGVIGSIMAPANAIQEYDVTTGLQRQFVGTNLESVIKGTLSIHPNGKLYGIRGTAGGTKLFELNPVTGEFSDIYTFAEGGALYFLSVTKSGRLYGTVNNAQIGGIFRPNYYYEFDLAQKKQILIKELILNQTAMRLVEGPGDKLYGYVNNSLVTIDTKDNGYQETLLPTEIGTGPIGVPFVSSNGKLYGMTRNGTATFYGSLFEYEPSSGTFTSRYNYTGQHSVSGFNAAMVDGSDNKIVGVSVVVPEPNGQIFTLDKGTGALSFQPRIPETGYNPRGGFVTFIIKADQSITFDPIENKVLGQPAFNLQATASSDLDVIYTTGSDKITVSASQITMNKAGRVTIKADQPGNDFFEPATTVERSFCINPAKPVISASNTTLTSNSDAGNQWYFNNEIIPGATSKTYTAAEAGSYTVRTSADDCVSEPSAKVDVVITGLGEIETAALNIYPNPADEKVMIELTGTGGDAYSVYFTDVVGRRVIARQSKLNRLETFDLTSLPKGILFVVIEHDGKMITRKLMVH